MIFKKIERIWNKICRDALSVTAMLSTQTLKCTNKDSFFVVVVVVVVVVISSCLASQTFAPYTYREKKPGGDSNIEKGGDARREFCTSQFSTIPA